VIEAKILAAAVALAGSASGAVGLSIGAAVAQNLIGFRLNGTAAAAETRAYIRDASLTASGALTLSARATQRVDAQVVAGAFAVAAGIVGVAAAGAGATTLNRIGARVEASIDGDGASGIQATAIALTATDSSLIKADTGAVALSVGVGAVGVAVSVGVAFARNEITTQVRAAIVNADGAPATTDYGVRTTGGGDIVLSATESARIDAIVAAAGASAAGGLVGIAVAGSGAVARNTILTATEAVVDASDVQAAGDLTLTATNTGQIINAQVAAASAALAAGWAGGAVGIGIAISENFIGFDPLAVAGTPSTRPTTPSAASPRTRR
jgi:hypothetical protein